MFKYFDGGGGVFVYWEPEHQGDAIKLTETVTGKAHKKGDYIEVTIQQRDKILKLYEDMHPTKVEDPPITVSTDDLMLGMTATYEEMLKRDTENKLALTELFESTLGGME